MITTNTNYQIPTYNQLIDIVYSYNCYFESPHIQYDKWLGRYVVVEGFNDDIDRLHADYKFILVGNEPKRRIDVLTMEDTGKSIMQVIIYQ